MFVVLDACQKWLALKLPRWSINPLNFMKYVSGTFIQDKFLIKML